MLLPVAGREPLGSAAFWPIYAAAEAHGLVVGVQAGGAERQPADAGRLADATTSRTTSDVPLAFQAQLMSLVGEGVFVRVPGPDASR